MPRFACLLIPFIFALLNASAQSGSIAGVVTDATNNQPLIGAIVAIESLHAGATTDLDGKFRIDNLVPASYLLKISYVGYETKEISNVEVTEGTMNSINISLGLASSNTLNEVVVTADARKENINSLLIARKNNAVISDAISADMIRRSPDKNTSEVLKRVSGITIQDNKFVVVRGMSDRYNEAQLNGSPLPSSEADRKTFAFDIFPAAAVDNITIIKSATPDLPGDFSGGLIELNTREIPDQNFVSVKIGETYNSNSTFKPYFTYQGGKTDWLGIDDGIRALPSGFPSHDEFLKLGNAGQVQAAQTLLNTWAIQPKNSSPLNPQLQVVGGINLGKSSYPSFGAILGVTYNETRKYFPRQLFQYNGSENPSSDTTYKFNDSLYERAILTSAMANFALKINANNKILFNNIYSVNSVNQTTLRAGFSSSDDFYKKNNSFYFSSNRILGNQLQGEDYIPAAKLHIHWSGDYTDLHRNEPDYRQMSYESFSPNGPYFAAVTSSPQQSVGAGAGVRYYATIDDHAYSGAVDLGRPFQLFSQSQTVKAGALLYYDKRIRDARNFTTFFQQYNQDLAMASQDTIFAPPHYNTTSDGFGLYEDNTAANHYDGSNENTAFYLMLDNKFTDQLRLIWGVRHEDYHIILNTFDGAKPFKVDTTYHDWLPSANLVYSVLKDANIRFSYYRSVARPSYRELANSVFYDFVENITYYGNVHLVETHIDNFEIRWEHYFPSAQYYSVSAFYKSFQDPIEQYIPFPGPDSKTARWWNAPSATNKGLEFEGRKNFGFISNGLENLYFYANVALIKSNVPNNPAASSDTAKNRPLQGQSPYVVNVSLQYNEPDINLGVSLLYNTAGQRLYLVSSSLDPSEWEHLHSTLDLKISKAFLKNGLVEFTWYDILHGNDVRYEDLDGKGSYNSESSNDYAHSDRLIRNVQNGYNLSLAVSYLFK